MPVALLTGASLLLTALSALETWRGLDFGIDELFFTDFASHGTRWPPGRPSPVTLINSGMLSLSILARLGGARAGRSAGQIFLLGAWLISFQSIVSYGLGINAIFGSAVFTQMSPLTALAFLFLGTGLLLDHRIFDFGPILLSRVASGRITRRLLLTGILLPPLVNLIQTKGIALAWWDEDFGTIVNIIGNVFAFSWLAFAVGHILRKAEEKEATVQASLRKAVASRDNFLSLAAHELRTPLTSMKLQYQMNTRSLKNLPEAALRERYQGYLAASGKQVERLVVLVNDMLDTSRIDTGKMNLSLERFELGEALRATAESMEAYLKREGRPVKIVAGPPLEGDWDRSRIEQVATNLIKNAVIYGEPGTEITLTLAQRGNRAIFSVHNAGAGIAREDQDRIFGRFERAATHQGGFGLGLFLVREIVSRHGGEVWVQSEPGQGALFCVELPFSPPPVSS